MIKLKSLIKEAVTKKETTEGVNDRSWRYDPASHGQPKPGDGIKPDSWQGWGNLKDAEGYNGADFRLVSYNHREMAVPVKIKVSGKTIQTKQGTLLVRVQITFLDDEQAPQTVSGWWNQKISGKLDPKGTGYGK